MRTLLSVRLVAHVLAALAILACLDVRVANGEILLVRNGRPAAAIYHSASCKGAAETLARYLKEMSGADVPVTEVRSRADVPRMSKGRPNAVVLGEVAREFGLELSVKSVSKEGFRLQTRNSMVLLAGETPVGVRHGVYEILERLGCGYFFDLPVGLEIPKRKTVSLAAFDAEQAPSFEMRRIWGSKWTQETEWKKWNRSGGIRYMTRHNLGALVPKKRYAKDHPEYYPLRGGKRNPRAQLCTSNPEVVEIATRTVIDALEAGARSYSLSPDDGGGFCECDRCRALDVPGYIEPSSGRTCVTDRFMVFWNRIAGAAYRRFPDRRLSFYAYSDYTLPPRRVKKSPPNLMMWMAPIRYCRVHAMDGDEACPRRRALKGQIQGWARVVSRFGFRTYNFNLAECLVPFSKVHVWRNDLPWLHRQNCRALNLESVHSINIMSPNMWLSARLGWDVGADVDELMSTYWRGLFGERAGPAMKRYWDRMDRAWAGSPSHAGSFFSVRPVYKSKLLKAMRADIEEAGALVRGDPKRSNLIERWRIFESGLRNAEMYMEMYDAFTSGRYAEAGELYHALEKHVEDQVARKWANDYTLRYLKRFVSDSVLEGARRVEDGNEEVLTLPDVWRFRYDEKDKGEGEKFFGLREIGSWREIRTYSKTIEEQGIEEKMTYIWYRNTFIVPRRYRDRKLGLWFAGVDKKLKVWINGRPAYGMQKDRKTKEVVETDQLAAGHYRSVEFDVTGLVRFGAENRVAVRVDHRSLSELGLGGIVKPVMLYAAAPGRAGLIGKAARK